MSDTRPIVFVVDDDVSVRESLQLLIESAGWQSETFASGGEFLARPRVLAPSCLVLDVVLPDLNGCDLQKLVADRADMPIIFITGHSDVPTTVRAMKAGDVDFFTKPLVDDLLLSAIRNAIDRSCAALGDAEHMRALRDSYTSLSRREREVMALIVAGRLNKQVGGELGISEITVKAHRGKMMRKMKADSLVDLVRMAATLRLTPAPKRLIPRTLVSTDTIVQETLARAHAAIRNRGASSHFSFACAEARSETRTSFSIHRPETMRHD